MERIPMPDLLDTERQLRTCGEASEAARECMRRICEYGQRLWLTLDDVRGNLLDGSGCLQPDAQADDTEWQRWSDLCARIGRVLAGARGDGGYAADEARLEARRRRDPEQPELGTVSRG